MADPARYGNSRGPTDDDTGVPRWVKVLGIIVAVVVLVVAVVMLTDGGSGGSHGGGGGHGGAGGGTPPASVTQAAPFGVTSGASHIGPAEGGNG